MGISATLIGRFVSPDLGRDLAPFSLAPCRRYWIDGSDVHALDESLAITLSRTVSGVEGAQLRAASPDLSTLIVTTPHGTRWIANDIRLELPVLADSASILPDGRSVLTAPMKDGTHQVLLVDEYGTIRDKQIVAVTQAGAFAEQHPSDGSVVVDFGEGQDGSLLIAVRVHGSRLDLIEIGANTVCAGFSPDGARLLLLPHPSFVAAPRTITWPGMREAGALSDREVDFDMYGSYLSPTRAL